MRTLIKLVLLAAVALGAYLYFVPGSYEAIVKILPLPKKIDPATGRPLVECTTCGATGTVRCAAKGCVDGKVECDGPCLRLTKGRWIKNASYGHGPDELWFVFPKNSGIAAVTKAHVGEVWEIKNGAATKIGECKICGGTTRMPCKVCKGTSKVACPTCHGSKEIPDPTAHSSTAAKAPAATSKVSLPSSTPPPRKIETIRLKDGSSLEGTIVISDPDVIVVRTADGKTTEIPRKKLLEP